MLDLVREDTPGDGLCDAPFEDDEVPARDVEPMRGAEGLLFDLQAELVGVLPGVVGYGVTSSGAISMTVFDGFAAASQLSSACCSPCQASDPLFVLMRVTLAPSPDTW